MRDGSMKHFDRRTLLAAGAAFGLAGAAGAEPQHDVSSLQDFDELWATLAARYAFFGEKATDWSRVRQVYRPLADKAETDAAYLEVLRATLAELYDPHTHLAQPPDGSPRFP